MVLVVARLRKKRFANDPAALKAAEDARIACVKARKYNRIAKLAKKELVRVLRHELPGAKVRQFTCGKAERWPYETEAQAYFTGSFDYAGATLAASGAVKRVYRRRDMAYTWISRHRVDSLCKIAIGEQVMAQISCRRLDAPWGRRKLVYYGHSDSTAHLSLSEFLSDAVEIVVGLRVTEGETRAAEEAARQQLADGPRSRKSQLAS